MPSEKRQRQRENSAARQQALAAAQAKAKRQRQFITAGIVVAVFAAGIVFAMQGGDGDGAESRVDATATTLGSTTTTAKPLERKGDHTTCPPAEGTEQRFTVFEKAPKMCIDDSKKYLALIKTDVGDIEIELEAGASPNTVNNFVFLARNKYYDGIIFHRVIPDFMDQTGDPSGTGTGGGGTFPGYQFADEIPEGYVYQEGDVAMANSGPNTNGSQFFLVASEKGAQTLLDAVGGVPKYSPFGRVVKGLDVVKKINEDGSTGGEPTVQHRMISVTITEE